MEWINRLCCIALGQMFFVMGITSAFIAISIVWMQFFHPIPGPVSIRVLRQIGLFFMSEVLLMFGIGSSLFGVRCVLGPRPWINRVFDYAWARAMWIALAAGLGCLALVGLVAGVQFLISLF